MLKFVELWKFVEQKVLVYKDNSTFPQTHKDLKNFNAYLF